MSDRKFIILFSIVLGICLIATIIHFVYIIATYENASIIQFIAREWWG